MVVVYIFGVPNLCPIPFSLGVKKAFSQTPRASRPAPGGNLISFAAGVVYDCRMVEKWSRAVRKGMP